MVNLLWYKPFSIDLFYERMFVQTCLEKPQAYSLSGSPHHTFLGKLDAGLDKYSQEHYLSYMETVTKNFEMLRSYKKSKQSAQQQLTTQVLDHYLEKQIFSQQFLHFFPSIDHFDGPHLSVIPFMIGVHQVNNLEDAENYLRRLSEISRRNRALSEIVMVKDINEMLPSQMVMESMVSQINTIAPDSVEQSIFFQDFKNKVDSCTKLTEEAKKELLFEAKIEIRDNLNPAYKELKETFANLLPNASPHQERLSNVSDEESYWFFKQEQALTTEVNRQILENALDKWLEFVNAELSERLDLLGKQHLRDVVGKFYRQPHPNGEKVVRSLNHAIGRWEQYSRSDNEISWAAMPCTHSPFHGWFMYLPKDVEGKRSAVVFVNKDSTQYFADYLLPALTLREIAYGRDYYFTQKRQKTGLPKIHQAIEFSYQSEGWCNLVLVTALRKKEFESTLHEIGALQLLLADLLALKLSIQVNFDGLAQADATVQFQENVAFPYSLSKRYVDRAILKPELFSAKVIGLDRFYSLLTNAELSGTSSEDFEKYLLSLPPLPWKILSGIFNQQLKQGGVTAQSPPR